MRIIGFNLSKISAERKEKKVEKIQLSQNINIKDVIKEKIPISESEALSIKFTFTIDYSEDFANVEFGGIVLILPEKDELKTFLKSWKDKKIPDEFRTPLFNFIMSKCNIKALNLEEELSIPHHIPMPYINPQEKQ